MVSKPKRSDVFICYSRLDLRFHDRVTEQLRIPLQVQGVKLWSDQLIPPGKQWAAMINQALDHSKVAVLLVSLNFYNSDFIQTVELPSILEAQQHGLTVLWVEVSETLWGDPRIEALQAAWRDPSLYQLPPKKLHRAVIKIGKKVLEALVEPHVPPGFVPVEKAPLDIHVEVRGNTEAQGQDRLLQNATEARFIAMTYKSLRLALTQGAIQLPNLQILELGIYALPVLKEWHPLLPDPAVVEKEWCEGIRAVLEAITNPQCAPRLISLDLRLINRAPGFTASQLTGVDEGKRVIRIRHTQIQGKQELVDSGTLVIATTFSERTRPHEVFEYFARAFDNTRAIDRSMLFPVKRSGKPSFIRKDIEGFVESLKTVTNLKQYALPDMRFSVALRVDQTIMKDAKVAPRAPYSSLEPSDVYSIFDYLRSQGRSREFRLEAAHFAQRRIVICVGDPSPSCIELPVAEEHIVGVFGLLLDQGGRIFIKDKPKPAWTHDVPGGRVSINDGSKEETLGRELFEELGLAIQETHIDGVAAVKYDPKGALAGMPVIALYLRYRLDPVETAYFEEVLPNATDGFPVVAYEVGTLIEEKKARREEYQSEGYRFPFPSIIKTKTCEIDLKDYAEAICHAPLEGISNLLPSRTI